MKLGQNTVKPVNLTHVIPYMHPSAGGPPVVVDRICKQLQIHGWSNRVVTTDTLARGLPDDWVAEYGQDYDLRVFASRGPISYGYSPAVGAAIDPLVAASRLVHIHTAWSYAGLAAMRACRRRGVPYVVMPHGMFDSNSLRRKWVKKQVYGRLVEWPHVRAAEAMIYTHPEEQRLAEESVLGLPQGFIVPLGADAPPNEPREQLAAAFLSRFSQLRGKRIVLFLSRLHPKKGLDLLIPAFRSVAACFSDVHLAIVGGGEDDYVVELRALVDREAIREHVTLTGPLNGRAKWEAMAAATTLVLPSYQENFALVVAEGMRIGLPIVLSRRVNIWADVVQAGAGLLCELSADSVAGAICSLLADPALAERMGRQGRQLAVQTFTWEQTAAAVEAVYRDVLGRLGEIACAG
jgi:glycosyltransferase involved in cell wall biosynthesis